MTDQSLEPFVDTVAEACEFQATAVAAILSANGVVAAPQPPAARTLRIRRISFAGEKVIGDSKLPFDFSWEIDAFGLWGLASEDNLVGKTTVLQVALWALRGTPKKLSRTVRDWLTSAEVSFLADGRHVDVAFVLHSGRPVGTVRFSGPAGDGEQTFEGDEQFQRVMQEIMLEALGLEPVPASRTVGGEGRVITYDDGWTAYTGAFLTDSDSNAIIGEFVPGTDLTSRLLQVFLGLPWATTMFQARSRARMLEADAQQRGRRLSALGGRSIDQVEAELNDVKNKISDEAARNRAAQELLEAQREYEKVAQDVRGFRRRADEDVEAVAEARTAQIRAERILLALREEQAAARFFGRLSPVCCPRCATVISEDKRRRETSEHRCSVCSEEVPTSDAAEAAAETTQAENRLNEAKQMVTDIAKAAKASEARYSQRRDDLMAAGTRLQARSTAGTAADVQILERRRERLEGMLEVARSVAGADVADAIAIKVLKAAEAEASSRLTAAAEAVLRRASDEICRIVKRLGMRDVERIDLKRGAQVDIYKGGGISTFSELSPGEQLRMRIATVAALVRSAREQGAGRHPGLLLIDSPGGEEMKDVNLADMLDELARLAEEIPGLQLVIAMRGVDRARAVVSVARLRTAAAGEFLW